MAIARALLVQSRVLVLDEALAGLEDAAANQILGGLRAEAEPRTIIALTERPASLRGHADKIVVLDEGRVVAEGRHDALLAAGGVYAQLCSGRGGAGHGAGVDGEPEWRRRLALADAVEEELMGLSSLSQETVGAPRPRTRPRRVRPRSRCAWGWCMRDSVALRGPRKCAEGAAGRQVMSLVEMANEVKEALLLDSQTA